MTDLKDHDKTKSGTLFLFVGPSGSGKGPLLRRFRETYAEDDRFHFPNRVITRAVHMPDETHIHATIESFSNAEEGGAFALNWHTHGHRYGIPGHAFIEMAAGKHVMINVSRTVVEQARSFGFPVKIFHIETPLDTSFKKLKARGRESEEEIAQRLKRHDLPYPEADDIIRIEMDGESDEAFEQANAVVQQILHEP